MEVPLSPFYAIGTIMADIFGIGNTFLSRKGKKLVAMGDPLTIDSARSNRSWRLNFRDINPFAAVYSYRCFLILFVRSFISLPTEIHHALRA